MSSTSYDMVASLTNTVEKLHQYLLSEIKVCHEKISAQDNKIILIDSNLNNINCTIQSITKTSQEIISAVNNLNTIYSNSNTDIDLIRDKIHYNTRRISIVQDTLSELQVKIADTKVSVDVVAQNTVCEKGDTSSAVVDKRISEIEWTIEKGYKNLKLTMDDISKRLDRIELEKKGTSRGIWRKMCCIQ